MRRRARPRPRSAGGGIVDDVLAPRLRDKTKPSGEPELQAHDRETRVGDSVGKLSPEVARRRMVAEKESKERRENDEQVDGDPERRPPAKQRFMESPSAQPQSETTLRPMRHAPQDGNERDGDRCRGSRSTRIADNRSLLLTARSDKARLTYLHLRLAAVVREARFTSSPPAPFAHIAVFA